MDNLFVNTLIQNILFERKWWLLRHLLFWFFIYMDEFLSLLGITESFEDPMLYLSFTMDVLVVYFNIYILFPKYLKKRKIAEYLIWTLGTIALLIFGEYCIETFYYKEEALPLAFYISVLVATGVTLSAAVAIKVLKAAYTEGQLREQAENDRLKFELKNLRKQINPHFLFNVLNGMYIQSKIGDESVSDTIMQFSDLLRYQIYDAEKSERVLLSKEIEFIENYIALEQIRRENTDINFTYELEDRSFTIEPMLFLPLVENAFKYSVTSSDRKSFIDIRLAQKRKDLIFEISNSIGNIVNGNEVGQSGFGLTNLRKRLALLYPNCQKLEIDRSKDDTFIVRLMISSDEMYNN